MKERDAAPAPVAGASLSLVRLAAVGVLVSSFFGLIAAVLIWRAPTTADVAVETDDRLGALTQDLRENVAVTSWLAAATAATGSPDLAATQERLVGMREGTIARPGTLPPGGWWHVAMQPTPTDGPLRAWRDLVADVELDEAVSAELRVVADLADRLARTERLAVGAAVAGQDGAAMLVDDAYTATLDELLRRLDLVDQRRRAALVEQVRAAGDSVRTTRTSALLVLLIGFAVGVAVATITLRRFRGAVEQMRQQMVAAIEGSTGASTTLVTTGVTELDGVTDDVVRTIESLRSRAAAGDDVATELERARTTAEQASQAKTAFLANMSHEVRTPLNAILGHAQLLREDVEDFGAPDLVADCDRIELAGRHLLALINQVLDLSKIESGKMGVDAQHIDVTELVDEIVATVRPLVHKRGNTLHVGVAPGATLVCDPMKLRQILFNLLSNAAKFTDQGSITLLVSTLGDRLEFTVQDTGQGMRPEDVERMFEPFWQADSRGIRGTGLGMAITRSFTELLGGTIDVESVYGRGTAFRVRIPIDGPPTSNLASGDDADALVTGL